ncbi:unnamed protein product, partial [marine sediment metagenome]
MVSKNKTPACYDPKLPYHPRTQKELYTKLDIKPGRLMKLIKELYEDFYLRIQGKVPVENEDEEYQQTDKILEAKKTVVDCHFAVCGITRYLQIKLDFIPRIGETITFDMRSYFPMWSGAISGVVHEIEGEIHRIKVYINPDENNQFDYFEWLQDNEYRKPEEN